MATVGVTGLRAYRNNNNRKIAVCKSDRGVPAENTLKWECGTE